MGAISKRKSALPGENLKPPNLRNRRAINRAMNRNHENGPKLGPLKETKKGTIKRVHRKGP